MDVELDLVKIKEWIVDTMKRAASDSANELPMSYKQAEDAFKILDSLNDAINTGNYDYATDKMNWNEENFWFYPEYASMEL